MRVKDEKMHYGDFVSLYPSVNALGEYPIRHPEQIISPKEYNHKWFGPVKCKILAPRGLYFPVLVVKAKKLLFGLCTRCMNTYERARCNYSDEERALMGTWWSFEINLATEMGCKVMEVHEVHHFGNTSTKLFRKYVMKFM